MVCEGQPDEEKQKLVILVEKKVKELSNEIQAFKDISEVLCKRKFQPLFYENGDLYYKEYLLKNLNDIKEDLKGFREEDHPLHGKGIVNLYEDCFGFFHLK